MSRRRPYVKHWSEYDRPTWADPAPDLWDAIDVQGHIYGPFGLRAEAEARIERMTPSQRGERRTPLREREPAK